MLKKIVCGNCGQINVVNVHERELGRKREPNNTFFGSEEVIVTEVEIDNNKCRGCNACLR